MAESSLPTSASSAPAPAALPSASAARALGASVVLVEREHVGGSGLHAGALASKALVEAAPPRPCHAHRRRLRHRRGRAQGQFQAPARPHAATSSPAPPPRSRPSASPRWASSVLPGEAALHRSTGRSSVGDTADPRPPLRHRHRRAPVLPDIAGLDQACRTSPPRPSSTTPASSAHLVIIGAGADRRRAGAGLSPPRLPTSPWSRAASRSPSSTPNSPTSSCARLREEGVADPRRHRRHRHPAAQRRASASRSAPAMARTRIDVSHILVAVGRAAQPRWPRSRAAPASAAARPIRAARRSPPACAPPTRASTPSAMRPAAAQSAQRRDAAGRASWSRGALLGAAVRHRPELRARRCSTPTPRSPRSALTEPRRAAAQGPATRVLRAGLCRERPRPRAARRRSALAKLIVDRGGTHPRRRHRRGRGRRADRPLRPRHRQRLDGRPTSRASSRPIPALPELVDRLGAPRRRASAAAVRLARAAACAFDRVLPLTTAPPPIMAANDSRTPRHAGPVFAAFRSS